MYKAKDPDCDRGHTNAQRTKMSDEHVKYLNNRFFDYYFFLSSRVCSLNAQCNSPDFTTQHILLTSLGQLAQPQRKPIRKIDCDDIKYRLAMHTMHLAILMMMLGTEWTFQTDTILHTYPCVLQ